MANAGQEGDFPNVDPDRNLADTGIAGETLDERTDQGKRQVIDAEIISVFEGSEGNCLS